LHTLSGRIVVIKGSRALFFFFLFAFSVLTFFGLWGVSSAYEEYTRSAQGNVSGTIDKLRVNAPSNLAGAIVIQTGEDDVCEVDLECWSRAKNSKMAKEFTELVEMQLDLTDQVVTIRLTTPRSAPWEGTDYAIKATLDIYIPPEIEVEVKTRHFDLDINGPLSRALVENDFGDITILDVSEETVVSGTYNKVMVEDLRGRVDIETSANSIRAENIDTEGRDASFETCYAEIEVDGFSGQLRVATSYAPVHLSDLNLIDGRNEISTLHSTINLELESIEDSRLYVSNTFGNINLQAPEDLSARLIFSVGGGGKIETNRILIRPQVLQKTRLEGICGDGDSEIELEVEGIGRILLEGR
jgi:hypothetical protein